MSITIGFPSMFPSMSSEEYHASDPVSKSLLDALAISPWHYEMTRQGVLEKKTNALDIGSSVHLAVLQPHLFDRMVVCGPADRRGNKWKDIVAANPGKIILVEEDYNEIFSIRQAVADHPVAQNILGSSSRVEESYFWEDPITHIHCKCRPDLVIDAGVVMAEGLLVDLKVVAANNANRDKFAYYIEEYSYDMQAAFYLDGVSHVTQKEFGGFLFLVVEKETHLIAVYNLPLHHDYVVGGRQKYTRRLLDLREYLDHPPKYLGYPARIQEIPVRSWYKKLLEEGELK